MMDASDEEKKINIEQDDNKSDSKLNDLAENDGNPTPSNTINVNINDQPPNVCCHTCKSTQECEEDIDNPGIYYCRLCWEEYTLSQQQGSGVQYEGSTINVRNGDITQSQTLALTQPQTQAMVQLQTQAESQQLEQSPTRADEEKKEIGNASTREGSQKDGNAALSNNANGSSSLAPVENQDNDMKDGAVEAVGDGFCSQSNEMVNDKSDVLHDDVETDGKICCAATAGDMVDEECNPSAKQTEDLKIDDNAVGESSTVFQDEGKDLLDELGEGAKSAETVVHDNTAKSQDNKTLDDVSEQVAVEEKSDDNDNSDSANKSDDEQNNNPIDVPNETNVKTKSTVSDEKSKLVHFLDNDEDPSIMTQETNIASKIDGLLTQAASMSEDEDQLDEDGEKEEINFEYEGVNMNADTAPRPPTIDTSEQIPLSGLTGPSQHLSTKSNSADDQLPETSMLGVAEAEVDADEQASTGQTEETFGSLYGAETQMLPPLAPRATNCSNEKNSSTILKQSDGIENAESQDHEKEKPDNNNSREQSGGISIAPPTSPESNSAKTIHMKITPRKGVLSMVSYPNDEKSNSNDSPKAASDKINSVDGDDRGEEETEQSQILLETSPMSCKRDEGTRSADGKNDSVVLTSNDHREEDFLWLSNRHESSPRLVLPSLKSNAAQKEEANNPIKTTAEEQHSMTAEETDDESMFGNYNAHPLESDPIEDTQTQDLHYQKQPTHLKRLSRGTPKYSSTKKDSISKSSSLPLNTRATNSSHKKRYENDLNRKSKSKITPKVLHYTGPEEDGESDAEFEPDEHSHSNKDRNEHFQKSEITVRALKQLEEVKEFTKHLPSIEEMRELASRKELRNEILEIQRSHNKEVNRLRHLLNQKEEIIREKNKEISMNHTVIKDRDTTIEKLQEGIKNLMNQVKWLSPSMPTSKKRKHTHAAADDDSDSESDRLVLSALKRPAESSRHKKQTPSTDNASIAKQTGSTVKTKKRQESVSKGDSLRPLSSQMWKELQDKGWKYKTGPEPYNKVYVPPDGSTHAGTSLGIHFFHGEQVVDAAIKRGHIIADNGESSIPLSQQSENEWSDVLEEKTNGQQANAPIDDSKLVGRSKIITLESGRLSIELVEIFMRQNQESVSFKAALFNPLWQRLKIQGGESNKNWRYEKCTGASSLSRNWCHVPPSSDLGSKGKKGVDFFVTEEEVVLQVLQEARQIPTLSSFVTNHESISSFIAILTRAVEVGMEYEDARNGKSPKTRTRKPASILLTDAAEDRESARKRSNTSPKPSKTPLPSKRKTPNTSFSEKASTKKRKRTPSNISPTFHSSQTQPNEIAAPSFGRKSPGKSGPLNQYEFFYSGIDKRIDARIKRLGGKVTTIGDKTSSRSKGLLFFLSDCTAWRRPKYIFAAALGVPMLHHDWLTDLEEKYKNDGNAKAMSSDLYLKHRLPIGLDHSTGVFNLQRASNARDWLRPGIIRQGETFKGDYVFKGMKIAIAADQDSELTWTWVLEALGATVITSKSPTLKSKGQLHDIDCCLLSSATLPPQVISAPAHVNEMVRHIPEDKPLLDLAWAHQSIIQRKRLPLKGDPRYEVTLRTVAAVTPLKIYSFKITTKGMTRRYEVDDLVEFKDRSSARYGRILGITIKDGKCMLEVQVLDKTGDFDLTDSISSTKIFIEESSLKGNIVMLGYKDLRNLAYVDLQGSNIFRQVQQLDESQL